MSRREDDDQSLPSEHENMFSASSSDSPSLPLMPVQPVCHMDRPFKLHSDASRK